MPGARSTGRSPQDLPGGPESPATSCPTGIPNQSQNRWHRPLPPGSLQSTCRPDTASLPSRRADRRHARADVIALAAAPRTTHPERLCSQAPVSRQSTERRRVGARLSTPAALNMPGGGVCRCGRVDAVFLPAVILRGRAVRSPGQTCVSSNAMCSRGGHDELAEQLLELRVALAELYRYSCELVVAIAASASEISAKRRMECGGDWPGCPRVLQGSAEGDETCE